MNLQFFLFCNFKPYVRNLFPKTEKPCFSFRRVLEILWRSKKHKQIEERKMTCQFKNSKHLVYEITSFTPSMKISQSIEAPAASASCKPFVNNPKVAFLALVFFHFKIILWISVVKEFEFSTLEASISVCFSFKALPKISMSLPTTLLNFSKSCSVKMWVLCLSVSLVKWSSVRNKSIKNFKWKRVCQRREFIHSNKYFQYDLTFTVSCSCMIWNIPNTDCWISSLKESLIFFGDFFYNSTSKYYQIKWVDK